MSDRQRMSRLARLALAPALLLALPACSMFGGSEPEVTATAAAGQAPAAEAIDPRRFIGPDYCPEIRIREGYEVARQYERGHEDDPAHVVWQASVGKTARECLYDTVGNLTLKIGVSGRVVAGPKGGAPIVPLPLRISVVKNLEAVLANQLFPVTVAIPNGSSTVFTEVHEITVPSPGTARDYIIYIGFDEKGEHLLDPAAARIAAAPKPPKPPKADEEIAVVEEPVEEAPRRPPPPPAPARQPQQPNVLPTPSGGFVLTQ